MKKCGHKVTPVFCNTMKLKINLSNCLIFSYHPSKNCTSKIAKKCFYHASQIKLQQDFCKYLADLSISIIFLPILLELYKV